MIFVRYKRANSPAHLGLTPETITHPNQTMPCDSLEKVFSEGAVMKAPGRPFLWTILTISEQTTCGDNGFGFLTWKAADQLADSKEPGPIARPGVILTADSLRYISQRVKD